MMKKLLPLALFTSYNKSFIKNVKLEILNGVQDDYQCFQIEKGHYLNQFLNNIEQFTTNIIETIKDCKSKQMKAIWIQLDSNQLALAEKLIEQGFQMHHCTQNYLLFSQWIIENEKSRLPNYTTHSVGAGGLIIHNNQILLIQEKNGTKEGLWGIPGGLVDDGELVAEAASREVKEETGLDVEPYDCFFFRDLPIANQYQGDIYFVIFMRLKNQQQKVQIQDQEIKNYQWVEINKLQEFLIQNKFGITQQRLMESIVQYQKSNRFGTQLCNMDMKPRVMYGKEKKYCLFKPNL
ncbi:unnamed protein product [Paramecium primaurelia]|uniref:Nudix hydrolase domain-containing protein n=1 Tax=Paramecium primaurelia TaxID=5886 RepID=A0A8S1LWW6_PARPR|nr:unnamed protein product [Paramecium primaurelia]